MSSENTQHKIGRIRPPRVHITYDVEIGDAVVVKELPFIIGIVADLSGHRLENAISILKTRKFVEIDGGNFDHVMASIGPRLSYASVNYTKELSGSKDQKINVTLNFSELDDFSPFGVLSQVDELKKINELRTHLRDLLAKVDGNDNLAYLLARLMEDPFRLAVLEAELEKMDADKNMNRGNQPNPHQPDNNNEGVSS